MYFVIDSLISKCQHLFVLNNFLTSLEIPRMSKKFKDHAPTIQQIQADNLSQLATKFWAPNPPKPHASYDPKVSEICNCCIINKVLSTEYYKQEINFSDKFASSKSGYF